MKAKWFLMVVLFSTLISGCKAFEVRDTRPQGYYSGYEEPPRVIVRERIIIRSFGGYSNSEYYQRKYGGDFYKHCNWSNSFCDDPYNRGDRRDRDRHDNHRRHR